MILLTLLCVIAMGLCAGGCGPGPELILIDRVEALEKRVAALEAARAEQDGRLGEARQGLTTLGARLDDVAARVAAAAKMGTTTSQPPTRTTGTTGPAGGDGASLEKLAIDVATLRADVEEMRLKLELGKARPEFRTD
jgi:hypothetical protein